MGPSRAQCSLVTALHGECGSRAGHGSKSRQSHLAGMRVSTFKGRVLGAASDMGNARVHTLHHARDHPLGHALGGRTLLRRLAVGNVSAAVAADADVGLLGVADEALQNAQT